MFPMNTSKFYDAFRMTQRPQSPMIYVKKKFGDNLLKMQSLLEIKHLDEIIRNITTMVDGRMINYSMVCGVVNEKCFDNPIINVLPQMDDLLSGRRKLKFPVEIDPVTYTSRLWVMNLGGVKHNDEGDVTEAKVIRLIYAVDESNSSKTEWIREWRKAFLWNVNKLKFHSIEIYPCPFLATELDIKTLVDKITPLISVAIVVVTLFCVMTYMTNSWVRSKPWMGFAATVSAGLAVVSSFGLMGAFGIQNISYNITLPFLIFEYSSESRSKQKSELIFMKFFRDKLAEFISQPVIKAMIILLYIINLVIGSWGVTFLKEGVNLFTLYPKHSKITKGYHIFYDDFTEFTFPLQIVINKTLDYSDTEVQRSIDNIMMKFQSHPNVAGSELEISWLKYYKQFQNHPISRLTMRGYDVTRKQDFIDGLRNVFLRIGAAKQFSSDINFNNNFTDIIRSRFFVVTKNIYHGEIETKVINDMWKIAEEIELPVIVHSYFSPLVEQGLITKRVTLQLFWLTALLIFIVFIAFVPNFVCALTVAIAVVSIIVETVGYMSFWGVNLDVISMMIIILCNGFCVNYPTHMCYAFLTSSHSEAKAKLKESLYHVGFPILQGSMSTIVVLLVFLHINMYVYRTFVKIIVLISLETLFHAVFVIPVFLSIIPVPSENKNTNNRSVTEYVVCNSELHEMNK
ncbi:patched domain-containing protein 3-like [Centruroides vittatus]|uniref:patched domain-containing protein 3-like n=1 Tax=Centruroides vittatus TaxID=120091 RepID=UPI00350EB4DF